MKKKLFNAIKYILLLSLGVFIFWLVIRKLSWEEFISEIYALKWIWIILSIFLGIFSHISRAIRWNMLIKPLGHNPTVTNSFLAIMIMYMTNLVIPRGGEVVRCSVLTRYEKVPFTKLLGTVVIERASDVLALVFFAVLIVLSQLKVFSQFFIKNPGSKERLQDLLSTRNLIIAILTIIFGIVLLYIFRKAFKKTKVYKKAADIWNNFAEGLKTIARLKNKWSYIGHTLFIYIMWLLALYVVFLSYEPTRHLSIFAGALVFVMGALGMIAPVQAGIGAYHFMVASTLVLYGISQNQSVTFAIIVHSASNLSLFVLGFISLAVLPLINSRENNVNPS
ncbi:lysylphosphatidylglycerol synthase transmembrane domain-containing protein [Bacteroidota bacterium]